MRAGVGTGKGQRSEVKGQAALVIILWLVVVAAVVGTYELGYQRGQIAALSEEVGK